jgi:hypothetical protein
MRAMQAPDPIGGRTVFSAGDRTYAWRDVLAAAEARGDVDMLAREAAAGLAALAQVDVPRHDVDAAGDDFRRQRRLLSADEMQAWLEHWKLTTAEWTDYLRREIARERVGGSDGEAHADASVLWPEAVCSGALGRLGAGARGAHGGGR